MNADPTNVFALSTAPPPNLSHAQAERIAYDHFGVSAPAAPLSSERDQNFRLQAADGRGFVLKIANAREDPAVTDFQTRALEHIASTDPTLPVPRVCPTTAGMTEATTGTGGGPKCTVRLLTYLAGTALADVASTPRLRRSLGVYLARLGRALRDFAHPAADHAILWDMQQAARLAELAPHIEDAGQRSTVARFVEHFTERVQPALPALRRQVIYNDLNPSNVLVDPVDREQIVGIIDFGDMVHAPLIVDVAVAGTYQLRHTADPFEAASELIAGYHSVTPLEPPETDLLFDLMATRLTMSVIISTWRASLYPDNREYILRNMRPNWEVLKRLDAVSRAEVQEHLRAACGGSH